MTDFQPGERVRVINPLAPDYGRAGTVKRVEAGRRGLVWMVMDPTPNIIDRGLVGLPRECLERVPAES